MNDRKLLPYEHELIKALGVTREEFLEFLAVQADFTRSLEERQQETRATGAEWAIALAIVGILFQVASVLLMPKPDLGKNRNQPRDARFAPRYGFNGSQELAQYGEPINLVYCNTSQNPKGAVRANLSLVWSAVESYGSSQFMQLLLVLGAARVKRIDFQKVAFGQLPISDFGSANAWLYYKEDGLPTFADQKLGDALDPIRLGAGAGEPVCKLIAGGQRLDGYSQSLSPSSKTSIGVYSPIPINVTVIERNSKGKLEKKDSKVTIEGDQWQGSQGRWKVGDRFELVLAKTTEVPKKGAAIAIEAANDLRYQYASSLDLGSVYMLGTARFKLVAISGDQDLDNTSIRATFQCIEAGRHPRVNYDTMQPAEQDDQTLNNLETALEQLTSPFQGTVSAVSKPISARWKPQVALPLSFKNTLAAILPGINVNYNEINYSFTGSTQIEWIDELDQKHSVIINRAGSLAYTKAELEAFLANKPKLTVKKLRAEYQSDLVKARKLRDRVIAGKYDKRLQEVAGPFNKEIAEVDNKITALLDQVDGLEPSTRANRKKIAEVRKQVEKLRQEQQRLFRDNAAEIREGYFDFIYTAKEPFVGVDKNRYVAGIELMEARLNNAQGESVTDQFGVNKVIKAYQSLITEKENAIQVLQLITSNWTELQFEADDAFFNKCLVKIDSGSYQTVTACDFVKFSLKCRVYRRVSGRDKKYGEKNAPEGYKLGDNGLKGRTAFFKVLYRAENETTLSALPVVFCIRRGADQDNFINLQFRGAATSRWQFRLEPIGDIIAEVSESGQKHFAYIENSGQQSSFTHRGNQFTWTGELIQITTSIKPALPERGPVDTNEWDLFSVRSDTSIQFSFDSGPEISVTAVTEQQLGGTSGKFEDMSTLAFGVFSGRGVQDLRSVSAYVLEGKNSWIVDETTGARTLSSGSTSYAPDIFADTVLDINDGIGKYAKAEGIGWQELALAKRFCKNNGLGCQLFMDGVIADSQPWRRFWAEVAPYSLLELARIGGKETLVPAVPVTTDGRVNREVTISALFNQGNILEGSYREEFIDYGASVQDLIATVVYRETDEQDVFPRNVTVDVNLEDVVDTNAIRQKFDLSQFVTQREQAVLYAKLLCNQRRWIRRGIEFQTFPTDSPISPGAYIYVDVGLNTWDSITSGVIMAGGQLNAPLSSVIANGSYSILLYKGGAKVVSLDNVSVLGGVAATLASYEGYLFVLGSKADRKRVFRVTEVQMDEEGQVTVKGMEHPCEVSGNLLLSRIADFSDSLFIVR